MNMKENLSVSYPGSMLSCFNPLSLHENNMLKLLHVTARTAHNNILFSLYNHSGKLKLICMQLIYAKIPLFSVKAIMLKSVFAVFSSAESKPYVTENNKYFKSLSLTFWWTIYFLVVTGSKRRKRMSWRGSCSCHSLRSKVTSAVTEAGLRWATILIYSVFIF